MQKRPLSVLLIACLLIVSGAMGLIYHLSDVKSNQPFHFDIVLISLVRILAIVSGVYMLRGQNWARWLAIVWIALHVVVSWFHSWPELIFHIVVCAAFAYFLFRPPASRHFRGIDVAAS